MCPPGANRTLAPHLGGRCCLHRAAGLGLLKTHTCLSMGMLVVTASPKNFQRTKPLGTFSSSFSLGLMFCFVLLILIPRLLGPAMGIRDRRGGGLQSPLHSEVQMVPGQPAGRWAPQPGSGLAVWLLVAEWLPLQNSALLS